MCLEPRQLPELLLVVADLLKKTVGQKKNLHVPPIPTIADPDPFLKTTVVSMNLSHEPLLLSLEVAPLLPIPMLLTLAR